MRTDLRRDLTAALKARDRVAVSALRSALAAIENAEAVPAPQPAAGGDDRVAGSSLGVGSAESDRRVLTAADLHAIVRNEVTERVTAADGYAQHGRDDAAERLRAEADVLRRYLPADH